MSLRSYTRYFFTVKIIFYNTPISLTSDNSKITIFLFLLFRYAELTTTETVCKISPLIYDIIISDSNSVYSWGDNTNFTLGHSIEQRRSYPERVEFFRNGIDVKDVSVKCLLLVICVTYMVACYSCDLHGSL